MKLFFCIYIRPTFFITLCCMCLCHVFNKEFTYLL